MSHKVEIKELRSFEIFQYLSNPELELLARAAQCVSVKSGETLLREDGESTQVCLVISGRVDVLLNTPKQVPHIIATLNPGELFGEIVLVEDQRRTATIVAKTDLTYIEWKKSEIWSVFEQNPNIGFRVLHEIAKSLAKRLAATNMYLRMNLG